MTGKKLIALLSRDHEDVLQSPTARFSWPFLAEHDLWFHRAFHSVELRRLLSVAAQSDDACTLAARGRLRRLLGDDAGAIRDLREALNLDPSLLIARAWLAETGLHNVQSLAALNSLIRLKNPPSQVHLYHSVACLIQGDVKKCLRSIAVYRSIRPQSALSFLIQGEALWRQHNRSSSEKSFAKAAALEPECAAAWLLLARSSAGGLPAVLSPKSSVWVEKALDADPTYALITLSWHGPRARPGVAWLKHLGRLLTFAFKEPERAGWYYRQDDIHYAPYHFQEYADGRALLAIRPDSAWAEALTARGALRCPPDPELAAAGLRHARRAAKLAPWAGWTRAWIGLGLIKSRRPKEAERYFTECL
ncbi:MAG: hypothetical protein ABL955_12540, partial [Elusimicrobiota bacterium]